MDNLKKNINNIQEFVDAVPIDDCIARYIQIKRSGKLCWSMCPFHAEDTASFVINKDKKFFYCFGCGSGGNVISFLMKFKQIEFPEAVREITEIYKFNYFISPKIFAVQREQKVQEEKLISFFKVFTNHCHQNLMMNAKALKYLQERGVTIDQIRKFNIGYDSGEIDFLMEQGYDLSSLKNYGILSEENWAQSRFSSRIILPIMNTHNQIIAVSSRALNPEQKPKYLHGIENTFFFKKTTFFNFNFCVKKFSEVYIVEGFFDMISLINYGLENVICTLGATISEEQVFILQKSFETINIIFDGDSAGLNGMISGALKFLPYYGNLRVRFIVLPRDEDPSTYLARNNLEELLFLPLEDFLWQNYIKAKDQLLDNSCIIKMRNKISEILGHLEKTNQNEVIISQTLYNYWQKKIFTLEKNLGQITSKSWATPKVISKERLLCSLLFFKAEEVEKEMENISRVYFKDQRLNEIAEKILSIIISNEDMNREELQSKILTSLTEEEKFLILNPQISVLVKFDSRPLSTIIEEEFLN